MGAILNPDREAADPDGPRRGSSRRSVLLGGAAGALGAAAGTLGHAASAVAAGGAKLWPAQTRWTPPPPQAPVKEGMADLGDVRLWYWDTGGRGEPVVLLHPNTGSGAIWPYQQPVLAAAGYRVIGYSRRGHFRSEPGPRDRVGSATDDLHRLVDYLELPRFHLVGCALGGFFAPEYALLHPERVIDQVIASSQGGVTDPDYLKVSEALQPKGWLDLPQSFRELGPSYRAANPEGVAQWEALERISVVGERVVQPRPANMPWDRIRQIRTRTLVIAGDCDLFMPPTRVRQYASHVANGGAAIVAEAGHSIYWEQPLAFNAALLQFFRKA